MLHSLTTHQKHVARLQFPHSQSTCHCYVYNWLQAPAANHDMQKGKSNVVLKNAVFLLWTVAASYAVSRDSMALASHVRICWSIFADTLVT